jgi:glycosyltransferase involved in cell wall biosynthesis
MIEPLKTTDADRNENSHISSTNYRPEISAVITCYFEESSISEFYSRLSSTLKSTGRSYEIVFVNDGSSDGTFRILKQIYDADESVTAVIDLFRNSGQAAAITAGLEYARGDVLLLMDSDLQLSPEDLPILLAEYDKGNDIVVGYREKRKDHIRRIIPSKIANIIMRKVAKHNLRDFGCTFKLFNSKLMNAFEFGPFNPLQIPCVISKAALVAEVPVNHHPRKYGKSGWTFWKLYSYNTDNFVRFSEIPFQIMGVACFAMAVVFLIRLATVYLFPFNILKVVTTGLILNVLIFCFLVTLVMLVAIGEFTIRNFLILSKQPSYVVKTVYCRLSEPTCNKD